jgi:hypothetical protein
MSADDVRRLRAELCNVIKALSTLDGWRLETLDEVLARAIRGPLSDLLPNPHYFRVRLKVLKARGGDA